MAPPVKTLTFDQHKQRISRHINKHKPEAPAPVKLTNSDVKAAVKGWIDNQLKIWMARVSSTQDAINQANMMYQEVMKQKIIPPIAEALFEKLVVGFAVLTLPEFFGAALVFKQIEEEDELRKKAAEAIADLTKEAAEEITKSLRDTKSAEDVNNAGSIGVRFFQDLYVRVGAMRDMATFTNVKLTHYIDVSISSADPKLKQKLDEALGVWYDAGLQTDEKSGRIDARQLALLFLYDLMRLYCSQCVRLEVEGHIFSQSWELTGLDPARCETMCNYFKNITWKDPTRPSITNRDDLLNNWPVRRADG